MKKYLIKDSKLARILKVEAIVLYPFIFFAAKHPNATIVNHELIHMDQIKRNGVISFYLIYLGEYLRYRLSGLRHYEAYIKISFEREAYENQSNQEYLKHPSNKDLPS
jgi:uncharacterized membrane protein